MFIFRVLFGIIVVEFIAETIIRLIAALGHPAAHQHVPGIFVFIGCNFSDGFLRVVEKPGSGFFDAIALDEIVVNTIGAALGSTAPGGPMPGK